MMGFMVEFTQADIMAGGQHVRIVTKIQLYILLIVQNVTISIQGV